MGPRSLAAPHRLRCLLPLGKRVESCPMGWCGPAKPLSPPRFHTFPHQILFALRGVILPGKCLIHRCIPHFGSTTSLPNPPPFRRRVVLLCFFVAYAAQSADLTCSSISAAAALKQLFTLLPPCMFPNWFSTTVIQVPQMRAQPFRLLLLAMLPLRHLHHLAGPFRPSVRVGSRHRIARLVRLINVFLNLFLFC